jgi:hypothetical protein
MSAIAKNTYNDPLEWYAIYIREIQDKSIEYKKEIWSGIVAREGPLIAEYLGDQLGIDEEIVSVWISEWIADRVRHTTPFVQASDVPGDMDVVEYAVADGPRSMVTPCSSGPGSKILTLG